MYTKQQLKDIIFLKLIDNITEEIEPSDLRLVLDAMVDAMYELQPVDSSNFYFGPWKVMPVTAGSIVISTDGTKWWMALQNFNSATEPSVNSAYWKKVADSAPASLAGTVQELSELLNVIYAQVQYNTQRLDNLQTPANPEGVYWKVKPEIFVSGTTIKAGNAAQVLWPTGTKDYPIGDIKVSVKPTGTLRRIDIVGVYADGTYFVQEEIESETPTQPAMPADALFATFILWSAAGAITDTGNKNKAYLPFETTGAVTLDYAKSPNHKGPASSTTSLTAKNLEDGGDMRALLEGCAGQIIAIAGTGNVDLFTGTALTQITLPASGTCLILVNNVSGVLHWSYSSGEEQPSPGGLVDTVNNVAPDAGTKNITLLSSHIDNTVNDATWWGTASLKIKGALDYLANRVKLNEAAILLRVKTVNNVAPDANGNVTIQAGGTSYTPPIPYTRTEQTGTTINFSQSIDQYRALTGNVTIADIINPVQGWEIVLEVDGTGNAFSFGIASSSDTVRIINASSYTAGKVNYVGLRCVNEANNTYIVNYI